MLLLQERKKNPHQNTQTKAFLWRVHGAGEARTWEKCEKGLLV